MSALQRRRDSDSPGAGQDQAPHETAPRGPVGTEGRGGLHQPVMRAAIHADGTGGMTTGYGSVPTLEEKALFAAAVRVAVQTLPTLDDLLQKMCASAVVSIGGGIAAVSTAAVPG